MKRKNFLLSLLALPIVGFATSAKNTLRKNKVIEFTPEILSKNNFGLYIIKDQADVMQNPDYACTVAWKLGYMHNDFNVSKLSPFNTYGKFNFLTDGWFYPIGTKEDVCNHLNNSKDKYRIMTQEEVIYLLKYRSNQKQLFYE